MNIEISTHVPDLFVEEVFLEKPFVRFLIVTYTITIFLLGILGSSFVLAVVIRRKSMQTSTNILLVNLAIADIFCCIFDIAGELLYEMAARAGHIADHEACQKFMFFSMVGIYFKSFFMAGPLIVHSFYQKIKITSIHKIAVVIWLLASAFALYEADGAEWLRDQNIGSLFCFKEVGNDQVERILEHFYTLIHALLPVILATCCIITHLIVKKSFLDGTSIHRMLFLMVAIFTILVAPCDLTVHMPHYTQVKFGTILHLWKAAHFWSMLDLIYKPILYVIFHKDFKDEFWNQIELFQRQRSCDAYPLHNDIDL